MLQCFADLQTLSRKSFTLDAAANNSGDNAHCSAFCSPSNSFLSKLHTGHIWINAPFTALHEFVQHYLDCKQASPSLTACILEPQFLLAALRPLLKGMTVLKKYPENTVLFDAPAMSGNRRTMTGVHWPVYVFTDAIAAQRPLPVITGQKCHPLHNATVHRHGNWSIERRDFLVLLDSGASTNFISKKVLDSCGLQLRPTTATLVLADGNSSPILGTARVKLQLDGFHSHVSCLVTDLATDLDLILGNTFLTEFKAILNYYTSNCTLVHDGKTYTLRPLSYNGANFDSPCSAYTVKIPVAPVAASARVPVENLLLSAAQCRRAIRKGCQSFLVMVNSAVATHSTYTTALSQCSRNWTLLCERYSSSEPFGGTA